MTTGVPWRPDWVVHPGESIREAIEVRGHTLSATAHTLGITPSYLSAVCNGRRAVTPELAIRLEQAGLGTAEFWLHFQANYDLGMARVAAGQTEPHP